MTETPLVLVVKGKMRDPSEKKNYQSVAIASTASKIFEKNNPGKAFDTPVGI